MNKKTLLVRAPFRSRTGYGKHAYDIVCALVQGDQYDLYLESCPWGSLPLHELDESIEINKKINDIAKKGIIQNPDIFMTLTIPNEFERRGKLNIGFTAGIETDRCTPEWLQKCNEMDFILFPSLHSLNCVRGSSYKLFSDQEQKIETGVLFLGKKAGIVFEGVDTRIFNNEPYKPLIDPTTGEEIKFKTDFNFLFVGHWLNGGMNEDRKNVAKLIRLFLTHFMHSKNVGLVLKTATGSNSLFDQEQLLRKINEIKSHLKLNDEDCPPIYIIHGNLEDEEMANLYKHPQIKGFVCLTHGEGYGRPIAEAAACELPIICTGWSGQMDFLDLRYSYILRYSHRV
jgi:glycosyltransferase involved in cell wall biosynthesis